MTESTRLQRLMLALLASSALVVGCDDGDSPGEADAAVADAAPDDPDAAPDDPDAAPDDPDAAMDDPDAMSEGPTRFAVTLENVSGDSWLPTPFAPGLARRGPAFFAAGEPDRGEGLEALAEDGDPGALHAALGGVVFHTPVGGDGPAPLFPGQRYLFEMEASPEGGALQLATMLVQSNDWFIAPGPDGVPLFDEDGAPLPARDVSALFSVWDAGTEADEAPRFGFFQAPRQPGADTGPGESVVHAHHAATRAIPPPPRLVELAVEDAAEGFAITVTNVSRDRGELMTPIAPVFFATHDDRFGLFEPAAQASAALESLAEDGSPAALVGAHEGAEGVGEVGAAAIPVGADAPGPIFPGDAYRFEITADPASPRLSLAFMVVQSNDAFIAAGPEGVPLFDEAGARRSAADLQADLTRMLIVWDAGTEANQVPGVGPDQAPRQAAANTGAPDMEPGVRPYADTTNDLEGAWAGGFIAVQVTAADDGGFDVRIENTSGGAFPGVLTPTLWALHGAEDPFITMGAPAPAGVEALAEDGNPASWAAALEQLGWPHGVLAAVNGGEDGPLHGGEWYAGHVMPTMEAPALSLATMVVPSNDTFIAVHGVRLLDAMGQPRADADIAADLEANLAVYEAGTEANQFGASGRDMAPHQDAADTGGPEGDGLVRPAGPLAPAAAALLRITIAPAE